MVIKMPVNGSKMFDDEFMSAMTKSVTFRKLRKNSVRGTRYQNTL